MKHGRMNVVLVLVILAMASISWAAGGYQYNLQCNGCHGMPPLDDSSRNPVTGGIAGKHSTHMGATATAAKCDLCHSGATNPSSYVSGHRDGQIQMFAKYNKGTFFNQTSVPLTTNATCATINCHFEAPATPNWLTNLPAMDCESCHNSPPRTSALSTNGSSASHTKHYSNAAAWGNPFGPLFCAGCHSDGGTNANGTPNFAAPPTFTFQHATSAANRGIHLDAGLSYSGNGLNFLPSQGASRVLGSCNNTYCHSNGVQGAGNVKVATPIWGTTATCASCHAATPTTNGHAVHAVNYAYGCQLCHSTTVSNNTTISNVANHTNQLIDVAFGGLAGTGSTVASCSTTYCHSGATTVPVWNNAASVACGSCHKADNITLTSNAHPAHLNSATLYGPTALQALAGGSLATSCKTCHTVYPANHANGTKDVTLTTCNPCHVGTLTTAIWAAGRVTCESCHTGATRSQIQGVTAPDMTLSASKGHTQATFTGAPSCNSCHNPSSAHISGVLGDNVRLTLTNDNSQCASCHNSGKTIARFQNMSTHMSVRGAGQDPNFLCKRCHDPHGSSNLSMIRTSIKKGVHATATSFTITYTDRANGLINTTTNRGLCQVCHTKTKYYLSGVAETAHPTSGCFDCHSHNAKGGAFKPTGTCDGCHGYPPVPKGLANLTFGTVNNYANGKFEDYSGGGGAHAIPAHVKASAVAGEGWANCAMCHNSGDTNTIANHRTIMPIKANIGNVTVKLDQKLRFNNGQQAMYSSAKFVYPGNKSGTCNNVECHFKPSARWSIQR